MDWSSQPTTWTHEPLHATAYVEALGRGLQGPDLVTEGQPGDSKTVMSPTFRGVFAGSQARRPTARSPCSRLLRSHRRGAVAGRRTAPTVPGVAARGNGEREQQGEHNASGQVPCHTCSSQVGNALRVHARPDEHRHRSRRSRRSCAVPASSAPPTILVPTGHPGKAEIHRRGARRPRPSRTGPHPRSHPPSVPRTSSPTSRYIPTARLASTSSPTSRYIPTARRGERQLAHVPPRPPWPERPSGAGRKPRAPGGPSRHAGVEPWHALADGLASVASSGPSGAERTRGQPDRAGLRGRGAKEWR